MDKSKTRHRRQNQPAWRRGKRAGLITPRSQDRNLLPVLVHIEFIALYGHFQDNEDIEDKINRHGAEEARGAHNSEDVRSKLTAGISPYRVHRSLWTMSSWRHYKKPNNLCFMIKDMSKKNKPDQLVIA